MGADSKIEWTDATWNPIRGCSRVSRGCERCYAESVAHRFGGVGQPYEGLTVLGANGPRWNGEVRFIEKHLPDPLRWQKPRRIFVNSMSDLFHENIPDEWIDRIFAVMIDGPRHTFQILTKRPGRMLRYMADPETQVRIARWVKGNHRAYATDAPVTVNNWPAPNIWLGVSVEDQVTADERIPLLLQTPARIRFISAEPLLGAVDLSSALNISLMKSAKGDWWTAHGAPRRLHWVIVGGESGHGARPMHPRWALSLRDQCAAAAVPYFFKQWGEWSPYSEHGPGINHIVYSDGRHIGYVRKAIIAEERRSGIPHDSGDPYSIYRVGKKTAGRLLDGREWNEMPEPVA